MKPLGILFNVSSMLCQDKKIGKLYLTVRGKRKMHPVYIEISRHEAYTLACINDGAHLQKLKKEIYNGT